jgi:hypothetical protein
LNCKKLVRKCSRWQTAKVQAVKCEPALMSGKEKGPLFCSEIW